MKKKVLIIFGALAMLGGVSQAQDGLPANPDGSKCYVKCVTPDKYEERSVQILKKPAYKKLEIIPAEYKTVTETMVIKEATVRYEYVPAEYKTVEETVVSEEPFNKLRIVPAKFSPASETIEVMPSVGRWEMGERAADCESVNPDDCRVVCWKEYPAQYTSVPTETKDKDETTSAAKTKTAYKTIRRQVISKPAAYREIPIPQKTQVVSRRVLVKDETTRETTIPAVYETVTKTVLVEKGGLTVWKELDCSFTDGKVLPIFYASGSSALNSGAKRTIDDNLLALMRNESLINVEVMSHTDSRGDDASNMRLSQRRAQSVVDYLVSKGISKTRLTARGYGETRLTNGCRNGVNCSETKHQANRRTEFRVISR